MPAVTPWFGGRPAEAATRAHPPTATSRASRRPSRRIASTAVAALLATALAPLTQPANAAVSVGENISVFPNRDMVVAVGYNSGEQLLIEVLRNDVVIGSTQGPAVDTPEGTGLEVNHGPLGTPQPGDCWTNYTPDIVGGDVIRVTAVDRVGAPSDTMTVKDVAFSGPPVEEADGTVSVSGTATPGTNFAVEFRRDKPDPRFRRGPFSPVFEAGTNKWKATFRPSAATSAEGLTTQQQREIALNEASWLAVADNITETTLAELGEPGGVGPGCNGSNDPNTLVGGLDPINIASGDVTFSGTARAGVAAVNVTVGALGAKAATLTTDPNGGVGTWTLTVPKAELVATNPDGTPVLPDGNVAVTPRYDSLAGTTRNVLKDTVAPAAPTPSVAPGTYPNAQSVALNKPAGETTSKVYWEIGADNVADPNEFSSLYTTQISVTSNQTIKGRLIDAAGNPGAVGTFAYRIGTPPAAPTGVSAVESAPAGSATVRWTAVTGATGYNVYRNNVKVNPTPVTGTSLADAAGLGQHSYFVRAVEANGLESANSNAATVTIAAPTVTVQSPAANATGVLASSNITATFSEAVTGLSTTTMTVRAGTAAPVAAVVTYDAANRRATLNPNADLAANTTYTVTLTGGTSAIRDAGSNALANTSWTFTTTAATNPPPTVTTRTPAVNATGVSTTGNITATFSEAVNGVSGTTLTLRNAAGTAVGATVSYNATTRVATLDPTATLPADTRYTATLTGGTTAIRDTAGAPLATTSWTFTTGPAPTVTGRTPGTNATGQSVANNITATFSENVTGVSGTTAVLRNAATSAVISSVVSYSSTTRVVTINPNANLTNDTRYTVTLTGGSTAIRDVAGNPLATTSWSFTTGPAPTITGRSPASGATNVGRTANVTATFSEPVTGVSGSTFILRNATTNATITAVVSYNATTRVATLNPSATLPASTRFTATLTGGTSAIRDAANNPLATSSWSFTTGA